MAEKPRMPSERAPLASAPVSRQAPREDRSAPDESAPGLGAFDEAPWLEACRRAVAAQAEVFAEHRGIEARTVYEGIGEGGDRTLVIDRLCEDVFFAELDRLHDAGLRFTAISEERGEVDFGAPTPVVVIDPIDGSLNARRTIPFHSLSVAVASGRAMGDVEFGFVHEFGAREEFIARRGAGALLDDEPLAPDRNEGLELVAMEATRPERMRPLMDLLAERVFRIRTPGSLAVSLCYVAAGRFDGMFSMRGSRSVDSAAGQLIVREAGCSLAFADHSLDDAPLDLGPRYHVAAARSPSDLDFLVSIQSSLE